MAGPGDKTAAGAAGRGRLRASHADCEQVIDTLKAAFVHGRLSKDELDMRVGQALASRTYAELANSGLSTPSTSMSTSGRPRVLPAHHGGILYVPVSGSRCPGWNRMIAS